MGYSNILYEKKDGIAIITLNRPDAMNSVDQDTHLDIQDALGDFEKDKAMRVAILTGSGRAFCTGADLKFAVTLTESEENTWNFLNHWRKTGDMLSKSAKPIIAAVNGLALAGGLELVMACDIVYASDKAKMGDQHAAFGLIPGGGGSQRLPRAIPKNKAMELILTGDWMSAQEAKDYGLVNYVVPHDQLMEAAMEMAKKLAVRSPLASKAIKMLVNEGLQMKLPEALDLEARTIAEHFKSPDMQEGLAAFNEKRPPNFKGE